MKCQTIRNMLNDKIYHNTIKNRTVIELSHDWRTFYNSVTLNNILTLIPKIGLIIVTIRNSTTKPFCSKDVNSGNDSGSPISLSVYPKSCSTLVSCSW